MLAVLAVLRHMFGNVTTHRFINRLLLSVNEVCILKLLPLSQRQLLPLQVDCLDDGLELGPSRHL